MSNNFPSLRITTLIVLCSSFWIVKSYSQSGKAIEWQNTIGADDYENLSTVQQTTDGGYILGGYSFSGASGDKTQGNWDTSGYSSADYWIVKTDALGNILWDKTIGGNFADYFKSIQQTSDGGYILGGDSYSDMSGNKTENNVGGWDLWIVKIDASGNIQWDNTIGGSLDDMLSSVKQTNDGGYIVLSSSYSGISGDKTEDNWDPSSNSNDYWIIKLDASGNIQWQNDIGGLSEDYATSIQQTSNGGYIIGGFSGSDIGGDKTEDVHSSEDWWVVKIDASGNIEWQNTIGGTYHDILVSLQQTNDGGYILGGHSESNATGDKTENTHGQYDYWVMKIDAAGNIQWQNDIGGNLDDLLYSIKQTNDGGYILGGYSQSSATGDKTDNSLGGADYWVVKIDTIGNIEWQNTIGGSNEDRLTSLQQTNDGNYILAGYSWSNISGYKTEDNHGGGTTVDYWIVKLTDNFSTISGSLFIDQNSNGLHEAGEAYLSDKKVTESNTGKFGFSKPTGDYEVYVLDTGNFSVSPQSINYYDAAPASQSAYFSVLQQMDSLNDFAFQPTGVYNDLNVHITPMGSFRPGFITNYTITYGNVGTTTLSPNVIYYPDSNLTFVSSNVTPTSVTADSIVWSLSSIAPYYTGNISVTVKVDSDAVIGTSINSEAHIQPIANDETIADNISEWHSVVTASYDPNAILVDRPTVLTTELASPPYLEYIVYFQNTGNDTAFNVSIHNKMPDNLDLNSFEFVASSHPVSITYNVNEQMMAFNFDNILLPDTNINEPASHGFIRYRIKPISTLNAGDSIENSALIYFDFNPAIPTNTALTEIVIPTNSAQLNSKASGLYLYPNPVENELIVQPTHQISDQGLLTIYDLFGRIIFQSDLTEMNLSNELRIDVSDFCDGVYFVEVKDTEKTVARKFAKQ